MRTGVGFLVLVVSVASCTGSRPILTQDRSISRPMSVEKAAAFVRRSLPDMRWMVDTTNYRPTAEVSAVIAEAATRSGARPGYIYLFHRGHYAGLAAEGPRVRFEVAGPSGGAITVRFGHYAPQDARCCPSLPRDVVHYRWEGDQVLADVAPPGDNSVGAAESE